MLKLQPPSRRALTICTALALGLAAAPAGAATLSDVVAYVVQVNPGLQAQRAALRALDESYVQARSGFGTSVSASTGATRYSDQRSGVTAKASTQSSALSVVQPIYTGGRVLGRVRTAEAQIRAGRETLRRYELDVIQRVVAAYMDVLRDEQLLSISQDTVAVLTKELADTQSRFNVHEITITDLAQAKARLSQALTQKLTAQAQLGTSRALYFGVVGQSADDLAAAAPITTLPASLDQALDAAEVNNPQLQSARFTEESSRAAVETAKAERYPSVSARFDMQRTPVAPYLRTPYDDVRSASVTFSQPLFSAGQISSGIRRSLEENNRDRLTIDETRLQVIQQVSSVWEQLVALRQQLTTSQSEVASDQLAFAGVRQEQKFALRSTIEVLNAELELSNAQQNLTRVRAAEYVSRVQLLAAAGVLTADMLSPGAGSYDPAANFRRVRNIGVTPLELPVRALELLTARPLGPEPPASIAEVRPHGPVLPPEPPKAEAPMSSIYSILERSDAAAKLCEVACPTAPSTAAPAAPHTPRPAQSPRP
jgi:TolC family type I secretion outer membrane protein